MNIWRVTRADWEATALSGRGSELFSGRWHERGTPVVYTSESLSLAVLETIAHLDLVLSNRLYVGICADLPDDVVERLAAGTLQARWFDRPTSTRRIGDAWISSASTVALEVPSVLPAANVGGKNYLLNPRHPDFDRVRVVASERFYLDQRLLHRPEGSTGAAL